MIIFNEFIVKYFLIIFSCSVVVVALVNRGGVETGTNYTLLMNTKVLIAVILKHWVRFDLTPPRAPIIVLRSMRPIHDPSWSAKSSWTASSKFMGWKKIMADEKNGQSFVK